MDNQHLKDIIVAIQSVRSRAVKALNEDNTTAYVQLMGDLSALELCLTIEVTKQIFSEEKGVA